MRRLIVKHNGYREDDETAASRPVFEQYDADKRLLGVVFHEPPGPFMAVMFEPMQDAQWPYPFWAECPPRAPFDEKAAAIEHVKLLLQQAPPTPDP